MTVTVKKMLEAVRSGLYYRKIQYIYDDKDKTFVFDMALQNTKLYYVRIIVKIEPRTTNSEECSRVSSQAVIGIRTDYDCMDEMAEFLHRENSLITFGNFALDYYDEGAIRFKMSVNCRDGLPGPTTIADLWNMPRYVTECCGDVLIYLSMGLFSAKEAVAKVGKIGMCPYI